MNRFTESLDTLSVMTRVAVYDILGRLVRRLVYAERAPGTYQVHWDGRNDQGQAVNSGIYISRVEAGPDHGTRKMVLIK